MSALDAASAQGIRLSNTVHSELAPCLPLPSLPAFCGAVDQELRLFDERRSLDRNDVLAQASTIADLLRGTDLSYLSLKGDINPPSNGFLKPVGLYEEVLRCNAQAFDYTTPGPVKDQIRSSPYRERKSYEQTLPSSSKSQRGNEESHNDHSEQVIVDEKLKLSSKKSKVKRKGAGVSSSSANPDSIIEEFCKTLEGFCDKVEIPGDDQDEVEWLSWSVSDLRKLVNEIMSVRSRGILHLVPVDVLVRLLRVLDHEVHRAEGLSIDDCQHLDSEAALSVFCALEAIHAAVAVMASNEMPKQIYKEEAIERILEFSRHQIMDIMCACDPSYRALHKPRESCVVDEDEGEELDADIGSASKRRRATGGIKVKKSSANKFSSSVNGVIQKLCTILSFLKDLLLIEHLADSCILQLVKTCFTMFLVDNIQLLQLKAVSLLSAVFYVYKEHRTYMLDETLQLLWKLPSSKRAVRSYHLPEEEQRQIQMVTALLIQLIQCGANLPESFRQGSSGNPSLDGSIDANYLAKSHGAVTEACCFFWSCILQRFASVKSQEASELKVSMENLIMDLLATLNLPEYPASAPILEVLCVLLLQNAGLKSKDISARSMAIDILGTIAARLKHNALLCSQDNFWITKELVREDAIDYSSSKAECSICSNSQSESLLLVCQGCQRSFHAGCSGMTEHEVSVRGWYCQFCHSRRQLLFLQTYCKPENKNDEPKNVSSSKKASEATDMITRAEIVQQMLLNYLQDNGSSDDVHHFARWFYLCFWYKDDPNAPQSFMYHLAKLKAIVIARDSGCSSSLTRNSVKKITLALGQNNSFSRGFDKILVMLLASLREGSPVIRAKALRAVSIIVEADPEVLCEERVQSAVEGRFCDSAISVREAALELVGRHIASHPDVGLQYFRKVAERIKDTGVSVRKRAIKIIREMCTSIDNFSDFNCACLEIISRVSDDEASIQDLVCKTFHEFWFEEPSGSQNQYFGDGSSVPLEVARKGEQIVEMLKKMPNHQLLITVIQRNLALDFFPQASKAAGINPVSLAVVRKRCELMCKYLLERILQVEETNGVEDEMHAFPYVLALHAFCVVDPTLCAPASDPSQFVVTLLPYLKSQVDNRLVANLLESIIFVVSAVLPLLRKLPQPVTEELEQDLIHMILRHSFMTVVHACIKCLCSVSRLAGKGSSVVEHLIQVFYRRLDVSKLENQQQVKRSLFCLGLLIRYGNSLVDGCSSSNTNLDVSSSLSLFYKYLKADDFGIKVRSLQALGYVLIARPECMLEKKIGKILEATLSSDTDCRLKIQGLQNLYEYLLDAESQMSVEAANYNNAVNGYRDGGGSVPDAAGAGDTNICGGIIQLYWNSILGRCLDANEQVRQSALKIVEIVLRQGLVHPITCVPYLISLETDPWETNSKLAHFLLMNLNDKYPSFFESRLGDGLQMSFHFMRSLTSCSPEDSNMRCQTKAFGNVKGKLDGTYSFARHGVSRIYKLIRGNRVSRNKFIYSVVRKFDSPALNDSVIPFLIYCTEMLALLPFTSPDEPLYLIYTINRVIQVRAGPLEANMKAMSLHLSQGFPDKASHDNRIIPNGVVKEEPADDSMPDTSKTHSISNGNLGEISISNGNLGEISIGNGNLGEISVGNGNLGEISIGNGNLCEISSDDMWKIQVDSLAATALELLLKLKRHLKIVHSLNDNRCQAYSPNEPIKAGEALSRQGIPLDIRGTHVNLPTSYEEFIQRYQRFKTALREDTVDYTVYTANIKRKRPPPPRATPTKRGRPSRMVVGSTRGEDEGSDDDDDADDDWVARNQMPVIGARKEGGSYRTTRQRSSSSMV